MSQQHRTIARSLLISVATVAAVLTTSLPWERLPHGLGNDDRPTWSWSIFGPGEGQVWIAAGLLLVAAALAWVLPRRWALVAGVVLVAAAQVVLHLAQHKAYGFYSPEPFPEHFRVGRGAGWLCSWIACAAVLALALLRPAPGPSSGAGPSGR